MIDVHCHILPGIDDGSPDVETSLAMLREEARQGVDTVVFTPHFYAERMGVEHFLTRRETAFEKLLASAGAQKDPENAQEAEPQGTKTVPETNLPGRAEYTSDTEPSAVLDIDKGRIAVYKGAEVAYFRGMGRAEAVPRLCVEGTDTILVEMPFEQWDEDVVSDIKELLKKRKMRVAIAHVERYIDFQKDRSFWEEVFDLPVVPQINAGTFAGGGLFSKAAKKKKWALSFIREHPDFLIGSDAHNLSSRRPNMEVAARALTEDSRFGEEQLARCMETARRMLTRG